MIGVAAGLLADRALGEPSFEPHPVDVLGRALSHLEEVSWRPSRAAGTVHALAGAGLGFSGGALMGHSVLGVSASTYLAVAGRQLGEVASDIGSALLSGDLEVARSALPSLVGRDPSSLDEHGITRAVVESVAENTVDAIVAPALWASLAGAPGAVTYRAVNTLDSMVGHRNERYEKFGWASARLDDGANFIPARATALLVMACRPSRAATVWTTVCRDAHLHPSPNAGVAEAAFAAALGVQLGGTNRYGDRVEHRAKLGGGRAPAADDIERAVALSRDVTLALAALLGAAGFLVTIGARTQQTGARS